MYFLSILFPRGVRMPRAPTSCASSVQDPRRVTKTGSAQTGDPTNDPADGPSADADETDPVQADQQD